MPMSVERPAGDIPHDTRDGIELPAFAIERLAPDRAAWAALPNHLISVDDHACGQTGVDVWQFPGNRVDLRLRHHGFENSTCLEISVLPALSSTETVHRPVSSGAIV